jgi:hypothetical protein
MFDSFLLEKSLLEYWMPKGESIADVFGAWNKFYEKHATKRNQ